jgi:type VI secretion system protein ImpL
MNPQLAKFLPYILGGVGVLIAAVVAGIVLIVKSSRKGNPTQMLTAAMKQKSVLDKQFDKYKQAGAGKAQATAEQVQGAAASAVPERPGIWTRIKAFFGIHPGQLGRSFRQAIRLLRQRIPGRDFRYRVPWFLMMGETGSGKTSLLNSVGLPQPLGMIGGDPFALRKGLTWWMFTNGIVLDIDGNMVLSSDGRSSDEGTWGHFLALLRRNRPERPIDGVIVTIPCSDLIGPGKRSQEDLRRKADLLYEKIWQAQKATGMTFPVYVFVTKCDNISGFRSFVSELPLKLRDDMFGWSNPYSIHSAYVPEWVDQAFANLNGTVYKTQIEIFAESETVEDSDGVFLFPAEFQTLIEPTRVYLNHLFKESAHHESFMFRGLYFCGDAVLDAPVATEIGGEYTSAVGTEVPKPVFLKHVFEKKIFPENRLARPVFRSVLARNRRALVGQIACVAFLIIGALALWLSSHSLRRQSDAFRPLLAEIEKDLTQMRDIERESKKEITSAAVLQQLEGSDPTKVLTDMQSITASTLRSVWIPASWTSDLDDRLHMALNIAFSKMVLGSIYLHLTKQLDIVNAMEPPEPPADVYHVVSPAALPEFQTLKRYVDRVKELEQYIALYNVEAAPNSGDLQKLGQLVKYVYGSDLPPGFYENDEFYLAALEASQQDLINTEQMKAAAEAKADDLGQRYFDALRERTLPLMELDDLQADLRALAEAPTTANSSPEPYRILMRRIDAVIQIFARPELAWFGKPTFDPGPEYKALLETMQASTTFGPTGRARLEDMATANFSEIRRTIDTYQSPLTGSVFQVADGVYKLSPPVLALRQGLEDFLNQRFMAAASGRRMRTSLPAGSRFHWDLAGLQQALQLVEPYNAFIAGGLSSFRQELQNRLRVMALNRLESNMVSILSAAQRVDTTNTLAGSLDVDVQAETKHLKDVSKPLSDLLSAFDRLGMTTAYSDLSDATQSSAFIHLREVDQLFDQKLPYSYDQAGLNAWNGDEPLLTAVFGARDEKVLPQYLETQRENLKTLVDYANPAVSMIAGQRNNRRTTADAQLLAKWQSMATEMEKYANKNPASSVAALEAFIGTVMPSLTVENYYDKIPANDVNEQSSDFFLNRRNDLRRRVYRRFDAIASARILRQYRELENNFNLNLSGKFPFITGASKGVEADPQSIRAFFKLFDASNKIIIKHIDRVPTKSAPEMRVVEFIDDMLSVRSLLAPFLDDPKAVAPIFDFEVEFRVNRRHEAGGNQIIDWQLEVGDQKVTSRDTMRRGRWVLGDPVTLSLRWAKDAPIVPLAGTVDGEMRKVVFQETMGWSMLRLLDANASSPADFDQLVDPAPQTLKFVVPTTGGSGNDPAQTRVFVRITLLTPDKKEPITLPTFPVRAPALDRL